MKLLSICVCTIDDRQHLLRRLLDRLEPQLTDEVELLIERDDGDVPIGAKRQRLLERAAGKYHCCLDDDDLVNERYVEKLLDACRKGPDVVSFDMRYVKDGRDTGVVHLSIHHPKFRDEYQWRQN